MWSRPCHSSPRMIFAACRAFPLSALLVAPLSAGDQFRRINDEGCLANRSCAIAVRRKPFLFSVSNPQPRKNIPLLIPSFYIALRRLPSWEGNLVLVGNLKQVGASRSSGRRSRRRPNLRIGSFVRALSLMKTSSVSIAPAKCLFFLRF